MMIAQFSCLILLQLENIKIVTINTWKCDGNYRARMPILARQLKNLAPGIVAVQECFCSDEANADTLKFLADELNMNHCFLSGRLKKRLFEGKCVESFSGLGILSTYPIRPVNQFDLPGTAEDSDRKVQQAAIGLPGGNQILITNTHLTHLGNAGSLRRTQAEALAGFVASDKSYLHHIICGDFNASRGSVEIETFKCLSEAIDCYTAGEGAEPRYSLAEAYSAGQLICVDHIFALPIPCTGRYPEFVDSGVVLNAADELTGLYPGDHFGISTTLVIR
jgi:endonuclease/exonuclease/phosphatase family metal-dependent hydrolase